MYPDPENQTLLRYWDGSRWTQQRTSLRKRPWILNSRDQRTLALASLIIGCVILAAPFIAGGKLQGSRSSFVVFGVLGILQAAFFAGRYWLGARRGEDSPGSDLASGLPKRGR